MKKTMLFLSTVLFTFLFTGTASAAFQCTVDINNILVYKDGSVNIRHSGRGDYTYICNLSAKRQDVDITTCAVWVGLLQSIKNKNGKAQFYYGGEGSCSTLPTYGNSPAPTYIGDFTN